MPAWIQVQVDQTTPLTPDQSQLLYQLTLTVTSAAGIERELFVYSRADDLFKTVATVSDLRQVPNSVEKAIAANIQFYRTRSATVVLDTKAKALSAQGYLLGQLNRVVKLWAGDDVGDFGGTSTYVYSGET